MSSTVEFKKVVVLLAYLSMTGVGCKPQSWGILKSLEIVIGLAN